jgi:hypothetical protein
MEDFVDSNEVINLEQVEKLENNIEDELNELLGTSGSKQKKRELYDNIDVTNLPISTGVDATEPEDKTELEQKEEKVHHLDLDSEEQVVRSEPTVTRKQNALPSCYAKAAQKYSERLEKQELMQQSAKKKRATTTPRRATFREREPETKPVRSNQRRPLPKAADRPAQPPPPPKAVDKYKVNTELPGKRATTAPIKDSTKTEPSSREERLETLRQKIKESEDKVITRADTAPVNKPSRHKWAERAEAEKSTTRTAEPVGKIPHRFLKKMQDEQKNSHIRNVKSFSELRHVRAAENLGLDPRQTNATLHDLRKLRAERRNEERMFSDKVSESNLHNEFDRIMNDSGLSKFAKAIALKKIEPRKKVALP